MFGRRPILFALAPILSGIEAQFLRVRRSSSYLNAVGTSARPLRRPRLLAYYHYDRRRPCTRAQRDVPALPLRRVPLLGYGGEPRRTDATGGVDGRASERADEMNWNW